MWRWLWLIALPLIAAAEYQERAVAPLEARSYTLEAYGGCYAMTATGTCEGDELSESTFSNQVCYSSGPVVLQWQAPDACEEGGTLASLDHFTIYEWVEGDPSEPVAPAAPRLVTLEVSGEIPAPPAADPPSEGDSVGVESTATYEVSSTATTHPVPKPSGLASGELWVVIFRVGGNFGISITPPAGWTTVAVRNPGSETGIYAVDADGAEGATVDFTTSNAVRAVAISYRISGQANGAAEIEGAFAASDVNDPPSVTPSWGGSPTTLYLAVLSSLTSDDTFDSAPTNYGGLVSIANTSSSFNTRAEAASAHRELAGSPEDPGAFGVTGTLEEPHSATIAIELASTGETEGAQTQAQEHSATFAADQTHEGAQTESFQPGLTATAAADFEAALSEGVTAGMSLSAIATVEAALSQGMTLSEALAGGQIVEAAYSQGFTLSDSFDFDTAIEAALSEGISAGFTNSAAATFEASLPEGLIADAVESVIADLNAQLSEGASLGATSTATGILNDGVTFSVTADMTTTGATLDGSITTPDGRTFTVSLESRTLTVDLEDRTYKL